MSTVFAVSPDGTVTIAASPKAAAHKRTRPKPIWDIKLPPDRFPVEPGFYVEVFPGSNINFAKKSLQYFLNCMRSRKDFQLLSTDVTTFFNGVSITVTYSHNGLLE